MQVQCKFGSRRFQGGIQTGSAKVTQVCGHLPFKALGQSPEKSSSVGEAFNDNSCRLAVPVQVGQLVN